MYREEMLGRLPLAIHGLTEEGIGAVYELVKLLGGKDASAWAVYLNEIRNKGLPSKNKGPLLVQRGVAQLEPGESHDPQDFYNNERAGSPRVTGREVRARMAKADKAEHFEGASLSYFETTEPASDCRIKADLPPDHVFSDEALLWELIARLTSMQPNGEKGPLAVTSCQNLFYLNDLVVTVTWNFDAKRWHIDERKLDNGAWNEKRFVFCRS